ncbi:MAG: amidohydrolase family protein [Rhodospirillales bacterium]|nr:amidohydrolase family protein [Rhodospirillales bacterium]
MGCEEMLLFSSDYPHWHYEGTDAMPDGLPEGLVRKILVDNALATYSRLNR